MKMLIVLFLTCAMMAKAAVLEADQALPCAPEGEGYTVTTEREAGCQSGWTRFNERCFLYVDTTMTWADAERNCQSRGGNLASVHSFSEQHAIQEMIKRQTQTYPLAWLGGSDAQQEGTWLWSDGSPFMFNYWDVGQPDNRARAHCLLMNFGDEQKFDDQPCSFLKTFVCARKL
ncbi:ladderlectin-like [Cheilinus undulatus]|uniref:ladderlectin-like n=1 Tax=Cheilinus undulatus TaxID=241271 RepID=UPI001BD1F477|nr:ladderlectin-like [Cheilinus undulatus]